MQQSYHQGNVPLSDNRDAMEAYRIFRWARNWLFVIILLCLILVQGAFWIVDRGGLDQVVENRLIRFSGGSEPCRWGVLGSFAFRVVEPSCRQPDVQGSSTTRCPQQRQTGFAPLQTAPEQPDEILADLVKTILRICNAVLVFSLALYFLVQVFSLNIAVVGRLGGLACSSKAVFLSLIMVVLVLPWGNWYAGGHSGVLFSYADLMKTQLQNAEQQTPWHSSGWVGYYFRFVGMWLIMLALLVLSQVFGGKAWKQILHRLRARATLQPAVSPPTVPSPTSAALAPEQMAEQEHKPT